jgi:hypothetical protein
VQTVLKPLIRNGIVNLWDDTRIQAGQICARKSKPR